MSNDSQVQDYVEEYCRILTIKLQQVTYSDTVTSSNLPLYPSGEFYYETGRKYYKIIRNDHCSLSNGQRSVHCFVNKTTGDVYMAASWKSPAKGVRFMLMNDHSRKLCFEHCDIHGSYLYKH